MPGLSRSIGLPQATAMVVGTIIGASIFVQPSEVSRAVPTFGGMLLVWAPGSAMQTGLTLTKVVAIAALLAMLVGLGASRVHEPGGDMQLRGFLRALIAGLLAFGGWHMVTYAAEETRDPRHTIPRALMLGVA